MVISGLLAVSALLPSILRMLRWTTPRGLEPLAVFLEPAALILAIPQRHAQTIVFAVRDGDGVIVFEFDL
jgi:hypothetical protein